MTFGNQADGIDQPAGSSDATDRSFPSTTGGSAAREQSRPGVVDRIELTKG